MTKTLKMSVLPTRGTITSICITKDKVKNLFFLVFTKRLWNDLVLLWPARLYAAIVLLIYSGIVARSQQQQQRFWNTCQDDNGTKYRIEDMVLFLSALFLCRHQFLHQTLKFTYRHIPASLKIIAEWRQLTKKMGSHCNSPLLAADP